MLGLYHGRAQVQTLRIGGRRDGRIEAYEMDIVQDAGAYPSLGAWLPDLTMMMAPGTYDIARVRARSRSVVTNSTPVNAYRGAGRPEATAAIERMIDLFAGRIGLDPIDVRRRNLIAPFVRPRPNAMGTVYDSGDYQAALDALVHHCDIESLRAEQDRRRTSGDHLQLGIGISTYVEVTGGPSAGSEHARVSVSDDGHVTVYTGTSPHGQGHETSWAMLAASELGVEMSEVSVVHGDTDLVPEGVGTYGSRSLQLGGSAVVKVSRELIDEAKKVAARQFEADEFDIAFDVDRGVFHVAGTPSMSMTWSDIATASETPLTVHGKYQASSATFPSGAHLAIVEVDIETGDVRLRRFVSADDAGRIINPMIAHGQRHGGIAQGIAQALYEEFSYDEFGNPRGGNLAEYAFPSAAEMPMFELLDVASSTEANLLGVKGIGESGTIGSTPAVHNAVLDALAHLGVEHIDMPLSPFKVWSAIARVC
jgi:carbon-monoxide dehydrogenase large subunit